MLKVIKSFHKVLEGNEIENDTLRMKVKKRDPNLTFSCHNKIRLTKRSLELVKLLFLFSIKTGKNYQFVAEIVVFYLKLYKF